MRQKAILITALALVIVLIAAFSGELVTPPLGGAATFIVLWLVTQLIPFKYPSRAKVIERSQQPLNFVQSPFFFALLLLISAGVWYLLTS